MTLSVGQQSTTIEQPVQRDTAARYSMPIESVNFSDNQPIMTSSFPDNCSTNGTASAAGKFNGACELPVIEDHRNNIDGATSAFVETSGEVLKMLKPVTVEETHQKSSAVNQKTSENQLLDISGAQHSSTSGGGDKPCSGTRRRNVDKPKRTGNAHYSFDERLASTAARELSIWRQAAEDETFDRRPPRPISSSHPVSSNRSSARAQSQESVRHLNDGKVGSALRQQAQTSPSPTNRIIAHARSATTQNGDHRSQSVEETGNGTPTQSQWTRCSRSVERVDRSRSSAPKSTATSPCSPAKGNERSRTPAGRRSADGFRSPIRRRSLSANGLLSLSQRKKN